MTLETVENRGGTAQLIQVITIQVSRLINIEKELLFSFLNNILTFLFISISIHCIAYHIIIIFCSKLSSHIQVTYIFNLQ